MLNELLKEDLHNLIKSINISVLPNAIKNELSEYEFKKITRKRKNQNSFNLLFLSNMDESKGWQKLLEACKILKKLNINFSCNFVGAMPSKKNEIKFKKFGYVKNNTFGQYNNWKNFIMNKVKKHLNEIKQLNILSSSSRKEILNIFKENAEIFSEIKSPRLNHGDFSFENMVSKNRKITGIFDLEWALSGDPEYDFKDLDDFGKLKESLLEGYQKIRKLSPNFNKKILLYNLLYKLELAKVSKLHWDKKTQKWVIGEILNLVKKVKSVCRKV